MMTNWADLTRDGKRLEAIIKQMNKKCHISLSENKPELAMAYAHTMVKLSAHKLDIAKIVLGLDDSFKKAKQILKSKIPVSPSELSPIIH